MFSAEASAVHVLGLLHPESLLYFHTLKKTVRMMINDPEAAYLSVKINFFSLQSTPKLTGETETRDDIIGRSTRYHLR